MTIVISGIAGFPGGSVVPGIGNVVGLAAGIIIGIGTAYLVDNDLTGDGKSLRDNIKDFVFGLIDGENNDEKEEGDFKKFHKNGFCKYFFLNIRISYCIC